MKILVPVQFSGVVNVEVPDHLDIEDQRNLAQKLALARCTATVNDPDSGECLAGAQDDYSNDGGKATEAEFDACPVSVGGKWNHSPAHTEDAIEVDITFLAQGHFNQTLRICKPGITAEQLVKALNNGSALTSCQENGDVLLVDDGLETIGFVVSSDSNCEYDEFDQS